VTPKNWNYLPFRFYTHGVLLRTIFFCFNLARHDWATQRDILSDCTSHWFEGSVLMLCYNIDVRVPSVRVRVRVRVS